MDREKMLTLAEAFLAAWNSQDVERVLGVYTDDVTYVDMVTIIKVEDLFYVWYTRISGQKPVGLRNATETQRGYRWDLAEIWYATSLDGFGWQEQGIAVPRPAKPRVGWRSVRVEAGACAGGAGASAACTASPMTRKPRFGRMVLLWTE